LPDVGAGVAPPLEANEWGPTKPSLRAGGREKPRHTRARLPIPLVTD
jgi:hypothetical protein